MKRIYFIWAICILPLFAMAQANDAKTGPEITFLEKTRDFGDIIQGDTVSHTFVFKNTGAEPLVLTDVITTCGCTAPSWSKQPVLPGQSGEITIVFKSAGKIGRVNKIITVLSNATNHRTSISIVSNILSK